MIACKCLVFAVCCGSLVLAQAGSEVQSRGQRSPDVSVLVTSNRNRTGHWTTKVILGHDNTKKSEYTPPSVEVEPRSSSCGKPKSTYDVVITIITPPSSSVLGDYELLPGLGHYKYHTAPETWPRAKEVCEQEGGHLVIVNSDEEAAAMVKLFAKNPRVPGSVGWTGLRESESTNGQYFTIFGDPLSSTGYTKWNSGEPNSGPPGDYMWISIATAGLGDQPLAANNKFAFICELSVC